MYSVKIFDPCPDFGGETVLLDFPTEIEAQAAASREISEASKFNLTVIATVIKTAQA